MPTPRIAPSPVLRAFVSERLRTALQLVKQSACNGTLASATGLARDGGRSPTDALSLVLLAICSQILLSPRIDEDTWSTAYAISGTQLALVRRLAAARLMPSDAPPRHAPSPVGHNFAAFLYDGARTRLTIQTLSELRELVGRATTPEDRAATAQALFGME